MPTEEDDRRDFRDAAKMRQQAEDTINEAFDRAASEEGLDDDERKNLGGLIEHLSDHINRIDEDPLGYVRKKNSQGMAQHDDD